MEHGDHPAKKISTASQKDSSQIPNFLLEDYVERESQRKISPSTKIEEKTPETNLSTSIGKLVHKALEYFVSLKREINKNEVKNFCNIYKDENIISAIGKALVENICTLVNEIILPLARNKTIYTELKVSKKLQDYVISGAIDLVIISSNTIYVIDYKTDKSISLNALEIKEAYIRQMAIYKKMIESLYPNFSVKCYLAWTHKPSLTEIDPSILDATNSEST